MLQKFSGKLSATPFRLNPHQQYSVVASQTSTSYLCSAVYYLLVYNPSRPCLTPECGFHLNQTRSLSNSYISRNQKCLPYMLGFNPAPYTPDFLRLILNVRTASTRPYNAQCIVPSCLCTLRIGRVGEMNVRCTRRDAPV